MMRLCFFQGAFGGSFLNHQYLVSATAPFYPNAAQSVAKAQIATLQSDDPADPRFIETIPGEGYRFIASVHGEG